MRNYWLTQNLFRLEPDTVLAVLRAASEHGEQLSMKGKRAPLTLHAAHAELVLAALPERNAVALLACRGEQLAFAPGGTRRALFMPGHLLELLLDDQQASALADRLIDASNIDEAKARIGLKHVQRELVRSIFVAGSYRRLNFTTPTTGLTMALEVVDADLWATHSSSSAVRQPAPSDVQLALKIHEAALALAQAQQRPRTAEAPAYVPPPLADGWVTLNKLRELGVTDEGLQRRVLGVRDVDALYELAGSVDDTVIDNLELHFKLKESRQAERRIDLLDIVNLGFGRARHDVPASFEAAIQSLTGHQRDVVMLDKPAPIRLKGGPGTGKTFTAVLRAGHLLRVAEEQQRPLRIGFFVFNRDLGEKVVEDMKQLGLDSYFESSDSSRAQRVVVASLFDWGERFLDLESLGVEPLAPYRADTVDKQRRAALDLAIDDARRTLSHPEHAPLWKLFDARSRHDFREIEMEISQFIKARELTDLNSYLAERRPPNWWLSSTEHSFKKFVWEIYRTYDRTLQKLGFIDADDVVNDCLKEVSKNTWQQYKKPQEGFDYLIIDEAQDFFRNQLTLASHLVKDPAGLMLCYDEAQAVYSRYPNLRELGFDTPTSFFGRSLESNFRSTKQIVRALKALFAHYPAATLQASWGDYAAGVPVEGAEKDGPLPIGAGFGSEATMLRQVGDLLTQSLRNEGQTCAVICFDDGMRDRVAKTLRENKHQIDELGGGKRSRGSRAVVVTDPKHAKGQQFDTCILLGVGRDQLPDYSNVRSELQRATRRDDALRELIVAMSRAKRTLHFLWAAPAPSEFISAMGGAIDLKA